MEVGEVYVCPECGLELKVLNKCKESDEPAESCGCNDASCDDEHCVFMCCGEPLQKK